VDFTSEHDALGAALLVVVEVVPFDGARVDERFFADSCSGERAMLIVAGAQTVGLLTSGRR
jgi:hypothetical protein